jgi:hypothetical protein
LLRDVDETRETALAGECRNDVEEALATLEGFVAFNLAHGIRMLRAGIMSPTCDLGQP